MQRYCITNYKLLKCAFGEEHPDLERETFSPLQILPKIELFSF